MARCSGRAGAAHRRARSSAPGTRAGICRRERQPRRNVATIRKPPKVEEREIEILTTDQIAEVRAKLAGHTLLPIVELALATGARRGELLALQWTDVDLDRASLRIERSVEETRAGLRLKPPKTKRGRRNSACHLMRSPCCANTASGRSSFGCN